MYIPAAELLLAWYDRHARVLPWRARAGQTPDPYHVWLSEVMLQQTTVAAVAPYFERFLERWPRVADLAAATLDEVLTAWAGLGYYARARNLHACAKSVAVDHGGLFPESEEELRRLPGVGDYTAAAIAAIAFGRKAVVLDGNIERVMARLFAVRDPLPGAKPRLKELAAALTPDMRPADYAQEAMDLGATLCTPKKPACAFCPLSADCRARAEGIAADLPARTAKPARPLRFGVVFWAENDNRSVLLRRRPERGLLGGMTEFPSTEWRSGPWSWPHAGQAAPIEAEWRALPGTVSHVFTHFHLELAVVAATLAARPPDGAFWCPITDLGKQALPSVMRKVAKHALSQLP
jgi:A/G-specific adenine glycosylase